jgi:hypothetical protein
MSAINYKRWCNTNWHTFILKHTDYIITSLYQQLYQSMRESLIVLKGANEKKPTDGANAILNAFDNVIIRRTIPSIEPSSQYKQISNEGAMKAIRHINKEIGSAQRTTARTLCIITSTI